ncbi:MAG TPA: hypothetical protein VFU78_00670, partial [Thermomicrobiales bacterium]|nr:hypothetical protein [Thermomicrobiales bacterium]
MGLTGNPQVSGDQWWRMGPVRALLQGVEPVRWVFAGDSITHGAAHTIGWRDYTELFGERVRWELRR